MSGSEEGDDRPDAASDWPTEPEGEPLPGEDNPGERLIEKYDPTVDEPESGEEYVPDPEDVDVPAGTARLFWYLVGVFDVAILALAIGSMLIAFRGRWLLGGQITLAGAVLLAYGYYRYRKHARSSGPDDPQSADGNG